MTFEDPIHILLVSFPAQGHINPLLRLAKCLAAKGISVIFTTTKKAGKTMQTTNNIIGDGSLTFQFFDDGFPEDDSISLLDHCAEVELVGRKFVSQIIKSHADSNKPISCIINNSFFSWVSDVAVEHDIPSALSWTNSSAVFAVCYNYVHKLVPFPTDSEPYIDVELPFVVLKHNEIPDFIHHPLLGKLTSEPLKDLSKVFCVFVDTYEELEHDFIDYISKQSITIRPVGPLFMNPTAKEACKCNNIHSDDCSIIEWLNTKPKDSVVYISFGTVVNHSKEQVSEIAYGLLNSQVSFLWALKQLDDLPNGFLEEAYGRGKVVKWCTQVEVLAHSSVGCFMTHCGWNSSMEAVGSGVQVLTFPSWGDQLTNAKFLVDVFGVGIRLGCGEKKLVMRDEVKKCLLEAMAGEKAEELKQNAIKWKKMAENAVVAGGSSDRHIDAFIEDIKKHCDANTHR